MWIHFNRTLVSATQLTSHNSIPTPALGLYLLTLIFHNLRLLILLFGWRILSFSLRAIARAVHSIIIRQ